MIVIPETRRARRTTATSQGPADEGAPSNTVRSGKHSMSVTTTCRNKLWHQRLERQAERPRLIKYYALQPPHAAALPQVLYNPPTYGPLGGPTSWRRTLRQGQRQWRLNLAWEECFAALALAKSEPTTSPRTPGSHVPCRQTRIAGRAMRASQHRDLG